MKSNPLEGQGGTPLSFGRFQCQEQLAGSGPFEFYRARTQGLAGFERAFAVKVLPRNAAGVRPDAAQRVLDLARQMASMRDRRMSAVVDCGTSADGGAYVVTEFTFGATLDVLGEQRAQVVGLPAWPSLLAHMGCETAWALATAHTTNPPLVHGALSPANITISPRGQIKVDDFGLLAAAVPLHASGGQHNLTRYTAPELLQAGTGSPQADVFALGAILFELATGQAPPSALHPHTATDVEHALASCPDPTLRNLLKALLATDAGQRPTAAQAAELLRAVVGDVSETELRSQLAALARKLNTTLETQVSRPRRRTSDISHSDPTGQSQQAFTDPPTHAPVQGGAAEQDSDVPQEVEEISSSMIELVDENEDEDGAAKDPKAPLPNMEGITTGEMDAVFAGGVSDAPVPLASLAEAPVIARLEDANEDFSEDAKTDFFKRGRVFPSQLPPPPHPQAVPMKLDAASAWPAPGVPQTSDNTAGTDLTSATTSDEKGASSAPSISPIPSAAESQPQARIQVLTNDDDLSDGFIKPARQRLGPIVVMVATASIAAVIGIGYVTRSGSNSPPPDVPVNPPTETKMATPQEVSPPNTEIPAAPQPDDVIKPTPPDPTIADGDTKAVQDPVITGGDTKAVIAAPKTTAKYEDLATPAPRNDQGRLLFEVHSHPPGATLWINGGARGTTPLTVPLRDTHRRLVLIQAGRKMVMDELDLENLPRRRTYQLDVADPLQGQDAYIDVRCAQPGKYPILVDGQETGWICPMTMAVSPGKHTVEIYVPWRFKRYPQTITVGKNQTGVVTFPK